MRAFGYSFSPFGTSRGSLIQKKTWTNETDQNNEEVYYAFRKLDKLQ